MSSRSWFAVVLIAIRAVLGQPASADQTSAMKSYAAKNYATAFREFLPLADTGNPVAQFFIAVMLDNGQAITLDRAAAAGWYRRAAEQGHASAQLRLASMYVRGEGVQENTVEAFRWASLAARGDLTPSQHQRAIKLRQAVGGMLPPEQRQEIEAEIATWSPRREPMRPPTGSAEARRKTGSGFFVDDRGHVLTNYHVVDNCGVLRRANCRSDSRCSGSDSRSRSVAGSGR